MAPNSDDRLFKIRLVIDSLLPKFQALSQHQMLCVAEQMAPFKGRSALKQYIPKKPYKWGYKVFVLCDTKGLMHSFDIFAGKINPVLAQPVIGASGNIVLELAQVIPENVNHLLYFPLWIRLLLLPTRGYQHLGPCSKIACVGAVSVQTWRRRRRQGGHWKSNKLSWITWA